MTESKNSGEPTLALVVAFGGPDEDVSAFLASLVDSDVAAGETELVFVGTTSADSTWPIVEEWARTRRTPVGLYRVDSESASEARNLGLERTTATWVSFPSPRDVLGEGYLAAVHKFVTVHDDPSLGLVTAHVLENVDGTVVDSHPSRARYERGSRVADLRWEPVVNMSVTAAFFRRAALVSGGNAFDTRVGDSFVEAEFAARFLATHGFRRVGLMASAKYIARQFTDASPLIQNRYAERRAYTDTLRYGHLALLTDFDAVTERWLENVVLHDLAGYFRRERFIRSPTAQASPADFDEFHALAGEILRRLGDDAIRSYSLERLDVSVRQALRSGYADEPLKPDVAVLGRVDEILQLVELSWWFTGEMPAEAFLVDGEQAQPVFETIQDFEFFGRTLVRSRRVWLPRGQATRVFLDGRPVPVGRSRNLVPGEILTSASIEPQILAQRRRLVDPLAISERAAPHLKRVVKERASGARDWLTSRQPKAAAVSLAIRSRRSRERFAHAWVFMDRDTDANDNGEHMYRHVWKNHPEVNSWFVLRRDSKDWARLEAEGFRLVDYGSFEWRLLILQADHLASSHIADYVVKPLPQSVFGAPRFYFTFLQHGVINYDLSRWLNSKRPDLFVVSTPQEKAAIGGHGPYFFTQKEVVLTGLPRFDSLLRKRAALSDDERDLIVIMPTWRQYLVGPPIPGSGRWARNPDFAASTFAKKYTELLTSKRIRDLAARTGKKIAFMPHPLLGEYLDEFVLPSDVDVLDFAVDGVQDVLARAAAFVTDYSSLGFEAGLLDIPLVYFHFDFSQFFSGSHSGRQGYFNYERDGFGPVVETVDGMYSALSGIADRQYRSEDTYVARTAATFPVRDGQSAERVLGAMKALEGSPRIVEPTV